METATVIKKIKTDFINIKGPSDVLAFYTRPGFDKRPHWHFVDPTRVRQIFETILPKLRTPTQISLCKEVLKQVQ